MPKKATRAAMRTLLGLCIVGSTAALTLPARAAMLGLVCSTAALTLPLGGEAELQCDRGSILDCARHALTQEPRLNASAQELVVLGLETLIARSPGAQLADLAGTSEEARVRAAADEVGGFACDGGRTLRRSRASAAEVALAIARARGFSTWTRADCQGPLDQNAGAALLDGVACDVTEAVDRAFAHLPLRAAIIIRGALPCTEQGYGGVWRDLLKLRRPTLDVAVAAADGGLAVLLRRAPRAPRPASPEFFAWPAAFDFDTFDGHRVELYGGPSVGTAHGRRFVDADSIVAWAVDVRRDVVPSFACADASLFTASLAISLEGNDDDWDRAALLGCPGRPWLSDALRAHHGRFRAVFVGANKGYGLASLLSILAPSLKVSPSSWGVSLRKLEARLACGWCRDCLEIEEEYEEDVSTMIEVDLVEPLGANVGLLAGCLRDHGFVEKDLWTKGSATVRLLQMALGRTAGKATFPALAAGEEVGEVCDGTCDVSQFAGRFEKEPRFEEVRVETLDGIIDGRVDYLSLDVEGHDPLVLDGGAETVKHSKLVEFEYHFRGAWARETLKSRTEQFDHLGFDCYLQGAHGSLWRLTGGCFDEAYEVRRWANVVCVRRDQIAWRDTLLKWAV